MKKMIAVIVILFLCVAGYESSPIIPPDGVSFDPNDAPSPVIAAYSVYAGQEISGEIDVADSDGDEIFISADKLTFSDAVHGSDPNLSTFTWIWIPSRADKGINYINITATDSNLSDSRTIVIDVLVNHPPIITGCRRI